MKMNELVYSFRDNNVRMVEIDNVVWFVAKDVCDILGIKNTSDATSSLKESFKTTIALSDSGSNYKTNALAVSEPGLYKLIFKSRKPEAEKFGDWVAEEVLPSIRKHGMYATDDVLQKTIDDPDFMIGLLNKLKEEKEERKKAESKVSILTHVNKTYAATEIAKELGLSSANKLNTILQEKKIQYKVNNTWVLSANYSKNGYTSIKQTILENGKVIYDRRWTQLGRDFIIELLKEV